MTGRKVLRTIVLVAVMVLALAGAALSEEVYKYKNMWPKLEQPWYFDRPSGVAVDGNGNVYVVDSSNNRIQKFTSNGKFITKWGSSGSGNGQFYSPNGIAIDANGNVYIADRGNARTQRFTANGKFIAKWDSSGSGDGQLNNPTGMDIDANGNIYVAYTGNHRTQKFTSDGKFIVSSLNFMVNTFLPW
ncbi:SBBP repeat-containing protein [Candidatus Magnetobacterium casense]|uniref:SBBP repeat-containing protein n=1 Tax=Candidatus Magnetobacterium casense TaxID=1455061 RepID=A0ABS6S4P7_9BACT|nr:SBBP repeat-containing protein [Candidatus Magnetobacterium casensis]MBV6343615.1 SBBP repeat-containing protein [Candidatus Magnetobacterium casensis]